MPLFPDQTEIWLRDINMEGFEGRVGREGGKGESVGRESRMGEQEGRESRKGARVGWESRKGEQKGMGRVGGLDGKGPWLESGCEEGQKTGRRED